LPNVIWRGCREGKQRRWLKRILISLLFVILLSGFCIFGLAYFVSNYLFADMPPDNNWSNRVAESVSPDAAWKAYVEEITHEAGFAPLSDVYDVVHLMPLKHPGDDMQVIVVDSGGHDDLRPRLAWTDANTLVVTTRDPEWVTVETNEYEGVRIRMRYTQTDAGK
jgi:hypothetical protein